MSAAPRILLVEDSATQALKLSASLEAEGMTVWRAASAEIALDRLERERPDLLIIDYHLPGMQGDELCRLLRLNAATETIPLLILTDDAEQQVERHGLDSGADDHVNKSADSDVLLARIHSLLRRPRTETLFGMGGELRFSARRILVVDDSATYLAFLEHELTQEGYRVETVESGEKALALINKTAIDCVVVDLVMPGIDGIELCRRLEQFRRSSHLSFPVLMVTGRDNKEDMMRALEAGADDFVSKSSDVVILKARIRAMLRRKSLIEEHEIILGKFRDKELELLRERSAKVAAEARAQLVKELEEANRELKNAHVQLVHSAKMASLGELVAGIAHEVNNPIGYSISHMGTILRILDELAEEAAQRLGPRSAAKFAKARQRAIDVQEGLARVRDLVIRLRTFSRLDEGEFKRVDMRESIESALGLIGHRMKKGITVTTEYADDNWLYCAPGPLNQVVLNLLSNAVDAVAGRGEIAIRTVHGGAQYAISVADSGPGIPEELQSRIFDPFFTTKDVGSGTGLGLSLAYKIVETHKGRIQVHNREGGGAEFTVTIPTDLQGQINAA